MSLTSLIRFRSLDSQLTDNEFFNPFTKSVGRELITKLLFNHFKNNPTQTSTITSIQSDIINKREENQQPILSYDCIDKLPSELISECASYFNYKQYFRMAQCNRKIYISCFASPKIQQLHLLTPSPIGNSESVNLRAFKNIQRLSITLKVFNALSPPNKLTWSNNNSLQSLILFNFDGNENDMTSFINNQHLINYNNVSSLSLGFFNSTLIFDILSKFRQLEKLALAHITFENNANLIDKNGIKKWFPNIRSLNLNTINTIFAGNVVEALHNELKSLTLGCGFIIPSNTRFPKLQSLKFEFPTNINVLLNPLKNLKSVAIQSNKEDLIYTFIENTICKQLALEHVKVSSVDVNLFSILQKIESVLVTTRNIKRKCKHLCIELIFGTDVQNHDVDRNLFGLHIFRIINALKISNINNWCLKIEYNAFNLDKEYLQNELLINEMKRNYFVDYPINQIGFTIIVSTLERFFAKFLI